MKKVLILPGLILFLISCAIAATYYVSPIGSASWDSCTNFNTPCSLSTANSNAVAGDVVYLRGGDYGSQILQPSNSGSSGNPITFTRYQSETPSFTNNNGASVLIDGKDYIVIDGLTFVGGGYAQLTIQSHGDYAEVKHCTFSGTAANLGPAVFLGHYGSSSEGISYVYFHDNTLNAQGESVDENEQDSIAAYHCDHGRVINNNFNEGGGHFFISLYDSSDYNVIRGNKGTVTTYWNSAQFPNKASLDGYFEGVGGISHNLIENNLMINIGSEGETIPLELEAKNSYFIFRKNVFIHPRTWISIADNQYWSPSNYNMIYGNTFYESGDFWSSNPGIVTIAQDADYGDCGYNQFINNIWDTTNFNGFGEYSTPTRVHDEQYRGNILYNVAQYTGSNHPGTFYEILRFGSGMTLATAESNSPYANGDIYSGNLVNQPTYTDSANGDFTPASVSPAIDNGAWLTTITSSTGSGKTSFTVDNPYFFYDGWGIPGEVGDTIKTQNGQTTTIQSINYNTNTITVSRAINIVQGEGLSLDYSGSKPDIGAIEYTATQTNSYCGDGTCDANDGESCSTCSSDCGVCPTGNSLANSNTMTANSNNFNPADPVEHLWDGCLTNDDACSSGTGTNDKTWIEFDFGNNYDLITARLFGDTVGNWYSRNWSLYYKTNSGDAWTTAFSEADAFVDDWVTQSLSIKARYARVEINGNPSYPAVQANELEIYGTAASTSSCNSLADSDGNSIISINELINYISQWKAGSVTIGNLIDAIGKWKDGC